MAHRSTLIVFLLAMLHAQLLVSSGQIDVTVDDMKLFLAPWLIFFIVDLIMVFPPLILWRIYLQRRFFERQLALRPRALRSFLRLSAAIFLSILAILWLLLSPSLAVGEDGASPGANTSHQTLWLTRSVVADLMKPGVAEHHSVSKVDLSPPGKSIKWSGWNDAAGTVVRFSDMAPGIDTPNKSDLLKLRICGFIDQHKFKSGDVGSPPDV